MPQSITPRAPERVEPGAAGTAQSRRAVLLPVLLSAGLALAASIGVEQLARHGLADNLTAVRDAHASWLQAAALDCATRERITPPEAARRVLQRGLDARLRGPDLRAPVIEGAQAMARSLLGNTGTSHVFERGSALADEAEKRAMRGTLLDGYSDAAGRTLIGSYVWLPMLELGVVSELEFAEAYEAARYLQAALLIGCLLVAGAFIATHRRRAVAEPPSHIYGPYTLGRKLGEGGMGVVYEASHRLLRRPTALKLLRNDDADPIARTEALGRFEREVQLTSQLNHPNTIVVYDYGQTDAGTFYYAMEYVDGVDLERLIRLEGPLPAARVIHLALQVCGSLAEAHDRGLIHRDIKPANILVCERGGIADFVKVLDFGLAKSLHGPVVSAQHVLVGTPLYMAPELVRNPASASPRSDLYSLGAVMHWLATGMTIHDSMLVSGSIRPLLGPIDPKSRQRGPGDPYHGVPADLERLIMRCLDSDPDERPESAGALADDLRQCRDAGRWSAAHARDFWEQRGPQLQQLLERPAKANARTIAGS